MVTIADVAKQAGVSMMTVSRVINKRDHVSEVTRKRVERVIEELGYRPNMVARGLATRRNQMIAYVVSDLSNPFFPLVSKGVQNACVRRGYTVMIYDVSDASRLEECVDTMIDHRIAGTIFHHLDIRQDCVERLRENQVRCVTIDNECELDGVTRIESDNFDGARNAVEYLIGKGFRHIGCIHGHFDATTMPDYEGIEYTETFQRRIWRDRTEGFFAAMRAHNLEPMCVIAGRGSAQYGMAMGSVSMTRLIRSGQISSDGAPIALYCENDLMALGALGECLQLGIRVPQDVAIVGHDGLDISTTLFPRITTVNQPRYDMGMIAAEKLIDAIEANSAPECIFTHSSLFVGDTT